MHVPALHVRPTLHLEPSQQPWCSAPHVLAPPVLLLELLLDEDDAAPLEAGRLELPEVPELPVPLVPLDDDDDEVSSTLVGHPADSDMANA